jgi:hypothetical protein
MFQIDAHGKIVPAKKPRNDYGPGSEHAICKAIIEWRDVNLYRFPWLEGLIHVANEGKRDERIAKAIGIKGGVSDYFCQAPVVGIPDLWLEVKKPGKTPTPAQWAWLLGKRLRGDWADWSDDANVCIAYIERWCRMVDLETKKRRTV